MIWLLFLGQSILDAAVQTRIARPTDQLETIKIMYMDGLGLELLGEFQDHEGFDGVILGKKGFPFHFEFTHHRKHQVGKAPSRDHLTVFYVKADAWSNFSESMEKAGFKRVKSYNPYWEIMGITFEDADGYRIVLQKLGD